MQPPFAMSSSTTPLYLEPVPDRHLLPEQRKQILAKWHNAIQQAGLEQILVGKLPPADQFATEPLPLDTAPTRAIFFKCVSIVAARPCIVS